MNDAFFPFPDRKASMQILHRDPCCGKILPTDVEKVFQKAWSTGEEQAVQFLNRNEASGIFDMQMFLKKEGFQVQVLDEDYVSGNMRYFCEYLSQKNIVRIYRKSIELWVESNHLTYEEGVNLILAHEYYHHLEWHKIGLTSRQYLVPMLKIGRFQLGKTGIAALSEIAANAFANRVYNAVHSKKL